MSFDRLNSLEAQPTTMRRSEDPHYRDDPDFDRLTESLSNQLFTLTSNITRLSDQIALLGTKRDTERVRERVHNLLEETRSGFKHVGEGIKKAQMWEDVNVCCRNILCCSPLRLILNDSLAFTKMDSTEAVFGVQGDTGGVPDRSASSFGEAKSVCSCRSHGSGGGGACASRWYLP
jgi:hypothetical protein